MKSETMQARRLLAETGCSLAVVRGASTATFAQRGIRPLVECLDRDESFLSGACVADKVIGKAAALLMVYGGVAEVFAAVISDAAAGVFEAAKVSFTAEKRVPYIINREGTGMCPMEQKALPMHAPEEAFRFFRGLVLEKQGS